MGTPRGILRGVMPRLGCSGGACPPLAGRSGLGRKPAYRPARTRTACSSLGKLHTALLPGRAWRGSFWMHNGGAPGFFSHSPGIRRAHNRRREMAYLPPADGNINIFTAYWQYGGVAEGENICHNKNNMNTISWLAYAFLSAIFAALVAIFGKIGLSKIDSTLATALRAVVMAGITVFAAIGLGKFKGFSWDSIGAKDWLWIVLAGVAGAMSWIFYFYALKNGPAPAVAAIDRLSLLFVFIMAVLFLKDPFTWRAGIGAVLVGLGAFMISVSPEIWQRTIAAFQSLLK